MPIADGSEAITPQLIKALQRGKTLNIVSVADICKSDGTAGVVSGSRASYILRTENCGIKGKEHPALYRYARAKFKGWKSQGQDDPIAEFMRLADEVEDASRLTDQRDDIAGTKLGQMLRTPKLMRPEADFDLVAGVHYIVRRSADKSTYMVGCVDVSYNPKIQHCEWTLTYFSSRKAYEIHGLVTEYQSNFHFFGFDQDTTKLHALSIHSADHGILCGVALTRDGLSMSGSRAVLVRPPKRAGFETYEACVDRLASVYEVNNFASNADTRADAVRAFVVTLGVGDGNFLDNSCKPEGILKAAAN